MWGNIAIAFLLSFIVSFMATPYTIKIADKIGAEAIEASMNKLNPEGFTYGNQTNEYVYYYSNPAYFLSAYSKSNYKEDRAVLFSDMIFRTLKKGLLYYRESN